MLYIEHYKSAHGSKAQACRRVQTRHDTMAM